MEVISIEENLKESGNSSTHADDTEDKGEDEDNSKDIDQESKPKRRTKRNIIAVPTNPKVRNKRFVNGRWRTPL